MKKTSKNNDGLANDIHESNIEFMKNENEEKNVLKCEFKTIYVVFK